MFHLTQLPKEIVSKKKKKKTTKRNMSSKHSSTSNTTDETINRIDSDTIIQSFYFIRMYIHSRHDISTSVNT